MTPDLVVDPTAVREVRENGSAAMLVVRDCTDRAAALTALELAREDLYGIPHPIEPDSPLPNSAAVDDTADGPQLWFDLEDEGPVFAERIVELVTGRLRGAGVGGVLHAGHDFDEEDDEPEATAREWSIEQPGSVWPADLPAVPGGEDPVVLGSRRHGERWVLAHWERPGPDPADRLVADLTTDGWALSRVSGDAAADPEVVGPFSDAGGHPGLRIWRAERDGRTVVIGSAPESESESDAFVVRATTPLQDIPAALRTRRRTPPATSAWPPGFPPDLPPVSDVDRPPAAVTAPGVDGASWRQVQWFRRTPDHATDFVAALTASGWQVEAADDAARSAMEAAFGGLRGGVGDADIRGWNAARADGGRLFVVSVPVPGVGAMLVVSAPAG